MENLTAKKIWCSRTAVRRRSVTTENPGSDRTARGSDTTPPYIVYRQISKFSFSIMVESENLNPPIDLRVRSSIARENCKKQSRCVFT